MTPKKPRKLLKIGEEILWDGMNLEHVEIIDQTLDYHARHLLIGSLELGCSNGIISWATLNHFHLRPGDRFRLEKDGVKIIKAATAPLNDEDLPESMRAPAPQSGSEVRG